jgi:hypothetical protein
MQPPGRPAFVFVSIVFVLPLGAPHPNGAHSELLVSLAMRAGTAWNGITPDARLAAFDPDRTGQRVSMQQLTARGHGTTGKVIAGS